ncbi:MAG: S8/S53 family peptidase [Streptosporangiaceae bacterium]
MPPIDFSTLVGPLRSLQVVIERWDELAAALSPGGLMPPRILPLSSAAPGYGDAVLRVAVVAHRPSLGPALVSGLRNRLRNARITGVTVDLGYYLSLVATRRTADAGSDTADRWSVAWNSEHVNDLRCPMAVRVPDSALGAAFVSRWPPVRKILMLDTGDEGAAQQKGFSLSWSGDEAPCDYSGHGTSTGSLMRMVASGAATHCFRVLQHGERVVHSGVLLNALSEALHPAIGYHLVGIPLRAIIDVEEQGKRQSLERILHQNVSAALPMPVVVCAAGNDGPSAAMDYPATVPGVIVAVGLDWARVPAGYNCRRPPSMAVSTVGAFGGLRIDPVGTLSRLGRENEVLYGSSYATALIMGAIAATSGAEGGVAQSGRDGRQ